MITNETIKLMREALSGLKQSNFDVLNLFSKTLDDLQQYKDLEDRFGCSLDVMFKALINGIYTKESEADKLELFEVRGIEKDGLSVISKLCGYAECDFSCKFKDYKKTWWLKANRGE